MTRKDKEILSKEDVAKIKALAQDKIESYGLSLSKSRPADSLFTILEQEHIPWLKYPIPSDDSERPSFSAALLVTNHGDDPFHILGLNTGDYYDKQLFAIAHELYHYYKKMGNHLSYLRENETDPIELRANRFAAEFLLPEAAIENLVFKAFNATDLKHVSQNRLERFIAKVHVNWSLPYRSIVRRLHELKMINQDQYDCLYSVQERSPDSDYYKYAHALYGDAFVDLNTKTMDTGVSPDDFDVIIQNYEDSYIDEDTFENLINLFGFNPESFNIDNAIDDDEIDGILSSIESDNKDES